MSVDIRKLRTGVKVIVQLSRRDNEDGTAPEWREPEARTLYVQYRQNVRRRSNRKVEIIEIDDVISVLSVGDDWAEYREEDYSPEFDTWLVENYRMRILSIVKTCSKCGSEDQVVTVCPLEGPEEDLCKSCYAGYKHIHSAVGVEIQLPKCSNCGGNLVRNTCVQCGNYCSNDGSVVKVGD